MFKHKCLIRKNNEFLRETLKKLGYAEMSPIDNDNIIATNDGHHTSYFTTFPNESIKSLSNLFIDCGRSETLFLGVAAMTDEHDKFQFFTTLTDLHWYNLGIYAPKGSLEFCMVTDRHYGKNPIFDSTQVPAVKSTIEDLMINFQDKEEDTEWFSKIPEERWKKDVYDFEYYPLTDEEKEILKRIYENADKNIECRFSSASTYTYSDTTCTNDV